MDGYTSQMNQESGQISHWFRHHRRESAITASWWMQEIYSSIELHASTNSNKKKYEERCTIHIKWKEIVNQVVANELLAALARLNVHQFGLGECLRAF